MNKWGIEDLKTIYKSYEEEFEDITEDKMMDYNYMIKGCIVYHDITPAEHFRVLADIGGKSPMSIFCDEYIELRDEIEGNIEEDE